MKTIEEIAELLNNRKRDRSPVIARMERIREVYNAEVVVPLPEMDRSEQVAVANLAQQGLDQTAMRIASVMPDCWYPSVKPGVKAHEERARQRRMANLGWWEMNRLKIKLRRRARHLVGYAASPVIIHYDADKMIPEWCVRDPLSAYPAETSDRDSIHPPDCIFTFSRSLAWLKQKYPEAAMRVNKGRDPRDDDLFELVEYSDAEELVLGVLGRKRNPFDDSFGASSVLLERIPNRAEMPLVVFPGRVTLDKPQGQFDNIVGMYQTQARLMALELIAVEKGVFPDTYLISRPNEVGKFLSGPHDSRSGEVNIVAGGDIKTLVDNPGYQTQPTINMLERYQRLTAGIPAEYGGESASNVRTGRRGDSILSAVVDFPVQEAQDILAESLMVEDKIAIAQVKAYSGSVARGFYVSWKGAKGRVDFTPKDTFDTDEHIVSYSHPGSDANGLAIGGGQRVGIGTLSKLGFMRIDPMVDDPEAEHDQVVYEGLEQAVLSGIQTQYSQPGANIAEAARIGQLVVTNKEDLFDAIIKVHEEAQKRQSATVEPALPGSPETQPGLAAPGQGAEAGVAIPPPADASTNLAQLLGALRRPEMTVPSER